MKALLKALLVLLVIASVKSNCTVIGAVVGGTSANSYNERLLAKPPAERKGQPKTVANHALVGGAIGLVVDVLVVVGLVVIVGDGCFEFPGPGEGEGGC